MRSRPDRETALEPPLWTLSDRAQYPMHHDYPTPTHRAAGSICGGDDTLLRLGCLDMSWSDERRAQHSEAMKARWADPETRRKLEESLARPDVKERHSAAIRARPSPSAESREKNRQSQLVRWDGDTEARQKMVDLAKNMWADPVKREELMASLNAVMESPEARQKMSEARSQWLADPAHREMVSEQLRRRWADPEYRRRMLDVQRAPWEDSPEWFGPFLNRLTLVAILRERDGDLCQLCLAPIPFIGLVWPDPEYPNVDHVRPTACGGTDDPDNLWLAHAHCNLSKGSRYVGRQDGSTDRRKSSVDGSPAAGPGCVALG